MLIWLLGPMMALFAVNSVLGYRAAIRTANEAYDRLLLTSVKAIADRVTITDGEIGVDIPYVALELFESNIRERIFYKVSAPGGATITGYEDLPPPPAGANGPRPVFFRSQYHGETVYQAALYKQLYDPAVQGTVLVQVAESAESRDALSQRILRDGLVSQGLLITAAAVFLGLGARHALKPLLRLRDNIVRRDPSDLTPVEEAGVQSEVRPLIQALNQHTGRIDQMIRSRVSWVADATHQIRTRLTILKTQAEYGARLEDPAAIRGVLADMSGMVEEASRFFNQLLVLARAEATALPGRDVETVDLARTSHALAVEWVEAARRKYLNLGFEGPESGVNVRGNAMLLAELVTNLLDNAVRYTPSGGTVTLRVRREDDAEVLEVEDNGPGIPSAERERVFERFYRGAGSEAEGTGLGLAIVREIVRLQQGSIELATPQPGRGLLVRVLFPRVAPRATSGAPTAATA